MFPNLYLVFPIAFHVLLLYSVKFSLSILHPVVSIAGAKAAGVPTALHGRHHQKTGDLQTQDDPPVC